MKIEVLVDEGAVAQQGARLIAAECRSAIAARGRFLLAVSGGRTPWVMLRALAIEEVSWADVHLYQVDERVAPTGHSDRNLTHLQESLLDHLPPRSIHVHAMPVNEDDLEAAAKSYAMTLQESANSPPVLDLVHLGLGPDGHTASLVPGDPVLMLTEADVSITGVYQGRRRMTLTYPLLNRARRILWVVTGGEKAGMLTRLRDRDATIPAGRVKQDQAVILADKAAAAKLESTE